MPNRIRTMLSLSTSVLVFASYLAMSTTIEYGPVVLVLPVIFFMLVPAAEWLDTRYAAYRKITTVLTLCYTLSIPMLLMQMGLFPTVVALVIYIQAYKLLHTKIPRDYSHIFLMSFFLVVASCVLSPDASIAVPLVLFLISAVWAFLTLQVYGEILRTDVPLDADILPLNARFADPSLLKRKRPFDFGWLVSSAAITLSCVLMTAVFFVATPRMEAGMFGGSNYATPQPVTGISETVDLAQSGAIQRDPSPVMRVQVRTKDGAPYRGPLYWRCTSLEVYNGTGWEEGRDPTWVDDHTEVFRFQGGPERLYGPPAPPGKLEVTQTIYLDRVTPNGLPLLWMPTRVESEGVRLRWDKGKLDGTVELAEGNHDSLFYEVDSVIDIPTPEVLERSPGSYAQLVYPAHLARLTEQNLEPDSVRLAHEVTDSHDTVYGKVKAVEDYLGRSGGFVYSLQNEVDASRPVDHFLQTSRMGHCELFASAMALMLRSLGIPTRVVTGYRGGEWSEEDKAYTVRADMAHLWVEVYFIDVGWVMFDPSPPADFSGGSLRSRIAEAFLRGVLKAKMRWYQNVIGYHNAPGTGLMGLSTDLLSGLKTSDPSGSVKPVTILGLDPQSIALLFSLAVLVAFTTSLLLRRRMPRGVSVLRRRFILSRDQLRAVQLFRTVRNRLRRLGTPFGEMSAEELLELLKGGRLAPAAAAEAVETYNLVRFGGRPLTRARYKTLKKALRTVR